MRLLLAFVAGLYARQLLDRAYLAHRRRAGRRAFLDGLLDAVTELEAGAHTDVLPDMRQTSKEVH